MELVKFKREQEQHLAHMNRIRNIQPMLDTSTPESLGLNHLAHRPKKMQLIEDRRQLVAKENAKLMGLMTNIMNEKREQPKYSRPPSLNEVERKKEVDRVNFENSLLASRLQKISPVVNNRKLERDFKRHVEAGINLRRRQMKPLSLPKDIHAHSPLRQRDDQNNSLGGIGSGLFDAELYASQRGHHMTGQSLDQFEGSIRNVADFRKSVIAVKKQNALQHTGSPSATQTLQHTQHTPSQDYSPTFNKNEALYELSHRPA